MQISYNIQTKTIVLRAESKIEKTQLKSISNLMNGDNRIVGGVSVNNTQLTLSIPTVEKE